jgi:hypothetical protein
MGRRINCTAMIRGGRARVTGIGAPRKRKMKWFALIALLVLAPLPAMAQPWKPVDGAKLEFDVLRDGGQFGTHLLSFKREGDTLTVKTDVKLRVDLGPINFFEYLHNVTETYIGDRLVWVGSRTKNEGKWKTLAAEPVEGGLKVTGQAFKGVLKGLVIPSTHWNEHEMKQPKMFSTETGEMLPMKVTDRGIEKVKAGGTTIDARRYDVDSELDASFWYDAQGRWVKCAFEAQGSKIEYVLRKLP